MQQLLLRSDLILTTLCVGLGLLACARAPGTTIASGRLLEGISDLRPIGDQNFSISPDGRWILYLSSRGSAFEPIFVLYDLATRQGRDIPMDPEVRKTCEAGRGPMMTVSCWNAEGTAIGLRGNGTLFTTKLPPSEVAWRVAPPDMEWQPWPPTLPALPYVVRQDSPRRAALVDTRTSEVLVTHRTERVAATSIRVRHLVISPDGSHLTYVVTEQQGSFSVPARGYLLPLLGGAPRDAIRVSDAVHGPMRWHPDGSALYAAVAEGGLLRWQLSDLVNPREGAGT